MKKKSTNEDPNDETGPQVSSPAPRDEDVNDQTSDQRLSRSSKADKQNSGFEGFSTSGRSEPLGPGPLGPVVPATINDTREEGDKLGLLRSTTDDHLFGANRIFASSFSGTMTSPLAKVHRSSSADVIQALDMVLLKHELFLQNAATLHCSSVQPSPQRCHGDSASRRRISYVVPYHVSNEHVTNSEHVTDAMSILSNETTSGEEICRSEKDSRWNIF